MNDQHKKGLSAEQEQKMLDEAYQKFPVIDHGAGDVNEKDRDAFLQDLINDFIKKQIS
jgi:hypothetical protein